MPTPTDPVGAGGGTAGVLDELRRAVEGDAWHGPSLREVLDGVTADQAAARAIPGAHSIGEMVLHVAAWTDEVRRGLRTGVTGTPESGDWPEFSGGEEGWREARRRLDESHRDLLSAVASFPASRLPDLLDSGSSYADLLHGLAQHHAYHGGQIMLLRRALGV